MLQCLLNLTDMERIGDIIKKVLSKKGQIEKVREIDDIEAVWCKAVESGIGEHSYVVSVKGKTITVRVDSKCYLTEIKRQEKEILSQLARYGWKGLTKIDCRIG
ncbi:MAG: DUF721 domain-containing protein [bacterium]|nr:DUF721 domain-containing protein [bacterium]